MAAAVEMTPPRRAVTAAILFLLAGGFAGVSPGEHGLSYRIFGLTEALLAFLLAFVLLEGRVWRPAPGVLGSIAVAYAVFGSAQILALLLPPPGALQWLCVVGLLFVLLAGLGMPSRRRLLGLVAAAGVLLALLRYSVIPFVWVRSGPGPGEGFGIGDALEGLRRLVVAHEPEPRSAQLLGALAVGLWIGATSVLARPCPVEPRSGAGGRPRSERGDADVGWVEG